VGVGDDELIECARHLQYQRFEDKQVGKHSLL
jgi:hypothetical protein